MITHIRRISCPHFNSTKSRSGFTLTESVVLLVVAVSLLWMALPIVLVHYGIIEPADVVKTQSILQPAPSAQKVKDKAPEPNQTPNVGKPTLPPSLERVTKGFGVEVPNK